MPRPTALLEIEDLLLFAYPKSTSNFHNIALIQALKKSGIHDVFLFTDARLDIKANLEVITSLKQTLHSFGLTVHGVVSPLDLTWRFLVKSEVEQFYTAASHHFLDRRNISAITMANDHLKLWPEKFKSIRESLSETTIAKQHIGRGFNDTYQSLIAHKTKRPESIIMKAYTAYIASGVLSQRKKIALKESLLQFFMMKKPQWVGQVIWFCSDRAPHRLKFKVRNKQGIFEKPADVFTYFIKNGLTLSRDDYLSMIKTAMAECPISELLFKLFNEKQRLKLSRPSLITLSPLPKLAALTQLLETLANTPSDNDKTVRDIVSHWQLQQVTLSDSTQTTTAELIAMQRNRLSSSSKAAKSQTFINQLLHDYGDLTLGAVENKAGDVKSAPS